MATDEGAVPDGRCGFTLEPADVSEGGFFSDISEWHSYIEAATCWRPVWDKHDETDRCFWHANVDKKDAQDLQKHRANHPECLDGAVLRGIHARGNVSFAGCGLAGSTFDNVILRHANFENTTLKYSRFIGVDFQGARFEEANLYTTIFKDSELMYTKFHQANLQWSEFWDVNLLDGQFQKSTLWNTEFHDSQLRAVDFTNSDINMTKFLNSNMSVTEFRDCQLLEAEFPGARLWRSEFHTSDMEEADFTDANLVESEFRDVGLKWSDFSDADLRQAEIRDADAGPAKFRHTNLHDAVFSDTDLRYATLIDALLYETVFEDTRINSSTTFSDPEKTYYDGCEGTSSQSQVASWVKSVLGFGTSSLSRPVCVYEENPDIAYSDDAPLSETLRKGVHRFEAARWVYRRLETLHEENALSEEARDYHISKEEAERKLLKDRGDPRRYVKTLMWALSKHGESVKRLLGWWVAVIVLAGLTFPFVGGVKEPDGTTHAITSLGELGTWAGVSDVLLNVYFSVITFSTIGYGDLSPASAWSRVLVAGESLVGAILVALLVFVLGRRVAR